MIFLAKNKRPVETWSSLGAWKMAGWSQVDCTIAHYIPTLNLAWSLPYPITPQAFIYFNHSLRGTRNLQSPYPPLNKLNDSICLEWLQKWHKALKRQRFDLGLRKTLGTGNKPGAQSNMLVARLMVWNNLRWHKHSLIYIIYIIQIAYIYITVR